MVLRLRGVDSNFRVKTTSDSCYVFKFCVIENLLANMKKTCTQRRHFLHNTLWVTRFAAANLGCEQQLYFPSQANFNGKKQSISKRYNCPILLSEHLNCNWNKCSSLLKCCSQTKGIAPCNFMQQLIALKVWWRSTVA